MLHTANYWNIWEKFIQSLVLEGPVGPLSSGCAPGCDWITLARASSWFMKLSMSSSELCVQAKGKWVETGWRSAIQSLSGIHCRGDKGGKGGTVTAHLGRTGRCESCLLLWTGPTTPRCRLLVQQCAASHPSSGGTEASTLKQLKNGQNWLVVPPQTDLFSRSVADNKQVPLPPQNVNITHICG